MYIIGAIFISMILKIDINVITSITLSLRNIPPHITLIRFTPYRYSYLSNTCFCTCSRNVCTKCSCAAVHIRNCHLSCHRLFYRKSGASTEMCFSVLICDVHMGYIGTGCFMRRYRYINTPCTISTIFGCIPY